VLRPDASVGYWIRKAPRQAAVRSNADIRAQSNALHERLFARHARSRPRDIVPIREQAFDGLDAEPGRQGSTQFRLRDCIPSKGGDRKTGRVEGSCARAGVGLAGPICHPDELRIHERPYTGRNSGGALGAGPPYEANIWIAVIANLVKAVIG